MRTKLAIFTACAFFLAAGAALADDAGQADLDKAFEAKLGAKDVRDLTNVIRLCDEALKKGLSEDNQQIANELLSGALFERGGMVGEAVFAAPTPPPQWPQMRQMALADLERAVLIRRQLPQAHLLIGRLHALPGGDEKRSRDALNDAVELAADDPPILAQALLERSRTAESVDDRLKDLNKAVELMPDSPKPLQARGLVYLEAEKPNEALADFDAAAKLDPENGETQAARGVTLGTMGKLDEAIEAYDRAVELMPESPVPLLRRGQIQVMAGRPQRAAEDFSAALKVDPTNIGALLLRADVHAQLDDLDAAIEDVTQALEVRPGLVPALKARAILYSRQDKFDKARQDLDLARKLAPKDTTVLLQLALTYSGLKEPDRAINAYTEVIELEPDDFAAYRGRADVYLTVGKQRDAVADYSKALELEPKDSGVLNNLAWVLATSPDDQLRDGKRAIELAKEACEVTEYKAPHILSTLAAGYAETGDFDTAIEWSKKAVELGSDEMREALNKELQSYEARKPWRELLGPDGQPLDVNASEGSAKPEEKAEKASTDSPGTAAKKDEPSSPPGNEQTAASKATEKDEPAPAAVP